MSGEAVKTKINFRSDAFRKYFKNTSWMFAEKIVRLLLSFVVGIYMIRYLGPSEFGILSYALSLVGLFNALAVLGLDTIVTRELVKTPDDRDTILGSVFFMRLTGGLLAALLLAVTLLFTGDSPRTVLITLMIGGSLIFQSLFVIEYYFQSKVLAKFTAGAQIANLLLTGGLKIFFIIINADLMWFAFVTLLESILLAAGFAFIYRRQQLTVFNWRFNFGIAKQLLVDAWPLILSGIVIMIYLKIGQVFITKMLDEEQNGLYAAAVRLCEAWYFIPMAVTASLFPAIVSAKQTSEELYKTRLQKVYDVLAWIAIGIALPVTFLSKFILVTLFGARFAPAAPVLTIYIWAAVPTFLGVANSQYLMTENLTRMSFYRTLMGMLANVALNYLLIPVYGITGSAIASLISNCIATFTIATTRRTFHQLGMMLRAIFFIDFFIFVYRLWQKKFSKK